MRPRGTALLSVVAALALLSSPVTSRGQAPPPAEPGRSASGEADGPPLDGGVATNPAEPSEPPVETIVVTADPSTASRYAADRSDAATKIDTPILETPQSVSVIPRARLVDLGALTIQDSLRYTAGVRTDAYGLDSRGDYAIIRGTEFTPYQDGLRRLFGSFNNVRPDVYALESVAVVRGPAAVLYGQGASGGLVNVTSKRPQAFSRHEIVGTLGNFQRRQIAVDSTGPLLEDESLLYRLVALWRDSNTQVDFVKDDRRLVAPSLTWLPVDWLTWTVLGNYQEDRSGSSTAFLPWEGTVLPNPNGQIPTRRFVSEPGYDRFDTDQWAVTSLLDLDVGGLFEFTQNVRYSDSGASYHSMFPLVAGDPYRLDPIERTSVQRLTFTSDIDVRALTADQRFAVDGAWGPLEHRALFGVDVTRVRTAESRGQGFLAALFNLYDPVYGEFVAPPSFEFPTIHTKQTGYYAQDQLYLGDLIGIVGIRYDRVSTESDGSPAQVDGEPSLRGGLLYRFEEGWSPYASYSESFEPVIGVDQDGAPFEPIRGRQFEAGIKYEPGVIPGLITLAWFDIEERNRLAPGENPGVQVQLGKARIRGFEMEASVELFEQLDLLATYTYLDGYSEGDPDLMAGRQNLPAVPPNSASAWARWRFPLFGVDGFIVGAGVRYTDAIPDETDTVRVPAVTLFDALLAWESGHWRAAVNAANLEDEVVVSVCLSRGDCFYGPRRHITGSLAYAF